MTRDLVPCTCPLNSSPSTQSLLPCISRGNASGGSLPVAIIISLKLSEANDTWERMVKCCEVQMCPLFNLYESKVLKYEKFNNQSRNIKVLREKILKFKCDWITSQVIVFWDLGEAGACIQESEDKSPRVIVSTYAERDVTLLSDDVT